MRYLVLVGNALLRHDRPVAVRQRGDRRGAHATGGAAAGEDHGVHLVPDQQRGYQAVVKDAGHALVDHGVALAVHDQPRVEFRAGVALLDVLEGILGIGARAPHAGVVGVAHVGDIGPDHRHVPVARQRRQAVDVVDLAGVRLVGRGKAVDVRIGALQIDVDQGRLFPKSEARAVGVGLDLFPVLARRQTGGLHLWHGRTRTVISRSIYPMLFHQRQRPKASRGAGIIGSGSLRTSR